jgi:hypothetical protein
MMKPVAYACLAAATMAGWAHLTLLAAETTTVRHAASIYADAQGGGLSQPEGVACHGSGQIVVGDTGNNRLLRFTYQDRQVSGGTGIAVPEVRAPARIHLNSKGDIYALRSTDRRIIRLGADGTFKQVLGYDGAPEAASVVAKGFAIDATDHLYVLDVFGGRILVLDPEGTFQKALELPADAGFFSEVAVDASGAVLVLDSIRRRIFSAAKDAAGFEPVGGSLNQVIASLPSYMTSLKGAILVVEGYSSNLVMLGRDGTFLSRHLTMGWSEGQLNHPSQVCVNDRNELVVADRDNSRIQIFQLLR